jgi:hypothetical protein
MTIEDIKALPVVDIAAKDCCLFLWGTWPMLPEVLEVVTAWGFTYKTLAFDWAKRTKLDCWRRGGSPNASAPPSARSWSRPWDATRPNPRKCGTASSR